MRFDRAHVVVGNCFGFVGNRLLARYAEIGGDPAPPALLGFYQSRRACLRARLALRHIGSVEAPAADAWRDRAQTYLALAREYVESFA